MHWESSQTSQARTSSIAQPCVGENGDKGIGRGIDDNGDNGIPRLMLIEGDWGKCTYTPCKWSFPEGIWSHYRVPHLEGRNLGKTSAHSCKNRFIRTRLHCRNTCEPVKLGTSKTHLQGTEVEKKSQRGSPRTSCRIDWGEKDVSLEEPISEETADGFFGFQTQRLARFNTYEGGRNRMTPIYLLLNPSFHSSLAFLPERSESEWMWTYTQEKEGTGREVSLTWRNVLSSSWMTPRVDMHVSSLPTRTGSFLFSFFLRGGPICPSIVCRVRDGKAFSLWGQSFLSFLFFSPLTQTIAELLIGNKAISQAETDQGRCGKKTDLG